MTTPTGSLPTRNDAPRPRRKAAVPPAYLLALRRKETRSPQVYRALPSLADDLREELLARLRALPFDAFVRCVALLLAQIGYGDVRFAGREDFRGRNQHTSGGGGGAGFDLAASPNAPAALAVPSAAQVIVAAKQYGADVRVFQRQVDELRGACLRAGASGALLVSTGPISGTIRHREALRTAPLAPLRLIDGEELATLLAEYGLGVRRSAAGALTIDAAFFDALEAESRGNGRLDFLARHTQTGSVEGARGVQAAPVRASTERRAGDGPGMPANKAHGQPARERGFIVRVWVEGPGR